MTSASQTRETRIMELFEWAGAQGSALESGHEHGWGQESAKRHLFWEARRRWPTVRPETLMSYTESTLQMLARAGR